MSVEHPAHTYKSCQSILEGQGAKEAQNFRNVP